MTTSAQFPFRPDPGWLAALLPQKTILSLHPEILDAIPRTLSPKRQNELDIALLDFIGRFPRPDPANLAAGADDATPAFWGPLKTAASERLQQELKKLPADGWLQLDAVQARNTLCRPLQLELEEWLEENLKPGFALKPLLEAAQDELLGYGGKQAWGPLVERHWDRIHGFFLWGLFHPLDRAEAPDLTQETFVRVFRHRSRFDAYRGLVRTWLDVVAIKLKYDFLRKRYPELRPVDPSHQEDVKLRIAVLESDLKSDPDDDRSPIEAQQRAVIPLENVKNLHEVLDPYDALLVGYKADGYRLTYIMMATRDPPFTAAKYNQTRADLEQAKGKLRESGLDGVSLRPPEPHDHVLDNEKKDGGGKKIQQISNKLVSSCQFEVREWTAQDHNRAVVWHVADTSNRSLLAPPGWSRNRGLAAFFEAGKNLGVVALPRQDPPPAPGARLIASGWLWRFWLLPEKTNPGRSQFRAEGEEL